MIRSNGSEAIIKIKISFGTHNELVREGRDDCCSRRSIFEPTQRLPFRYH